MDTDSIVVAMRSPASGSAALVRAGRRRRVALVATVPSCIEGEDVCSRPEHMAAAEFSPADPAVFLDAVMDLVEPVDVWFLWRPNLRDPGDELLVEAVNGPAAAIATFNWRGSRPAADRLRILLPAEAMQRAA